MTAEPLPIGRRATDRRVDERRGDDRLAEDRRGEERRVDERRGAPDGQERRGGVAEDWRAAQPDAWKLAGFKMQIADEARQRRGSVSMNLAVWSGVALGVAGSVVALFL